ncbi:MAG: hypothetical protein QHC65_17920 [Sphingomonas sp.]|nr:hypothetical protein [Sphingomonas sp.]MDX3886304.1 hypothetical protein [Sphingomonas sp.]
MTIAGVTLLPFDGATPDVSRAGFVAPGSRLIGDVVLGEGASVWSCIPQVAWRLR